LNPNSFLFFKPVSSHSRFGPKLSITEFLEYKEAVFFRAIGKF